MSQNEVATVAKASMGIITRLEDDLRKTRIALLMCAAHCQGGHSEAGAEAAEVLGTTFPITMEKLARVARKEGLDPDKLWPWWKQLKQREGRA